MIGTLINETNSDFFLPAVPAEALINSDIFVGVTDDETDTACGVLAAAAVGDHVLAIRFLWVAEEFRGRGAGTELVNTLIEAAEAMDAASISCVHSRGNVSDGVEETLMGCGFAKYEEQTSPIYAVSLSELSTVRRSGRETEDPASGIRIRSLAKIDDKKWQVAGFKWKDSDGPDAGSRAFARRRESYDPNLSFVALDDKGNITGMLLGICRDDEYELQTMSAIGKQAPRILLALIEHMTDVAAKKLGEDGSIIICPPNDSSMKLIEQFTGGAYITVGETDLYTYEL